MKTCFKCHRSLPLDSFYEHPRMADGHLGKCKECTKRDTKKHYRVAHSQIMEYERRRGEKPERRADQCVYARRMRAKYPEKFKARAAVKRAVARGVLVRPAACRRCGATDRRIEAHHHDYSKPLDVDFMCSRCHAAEDRPLLPVD